jgi:hypothetical protein
MELHFWSFGDWICDIHKNDMIGNLNLTSRPARHSCMFEPNPPDNVPVLHPAPSTQASLHPRRVVLNTAFAYQCHWYTNAVLASPPYLASYECVPLIHNLHLGIILATHQKCRVVA